MPYSKKIWTNNSSPPINASALNNMESGIAAAVRYETLSNADFNTITTRGMYTVSGTLTNAPTSGTYWGLIVIPTTANSTAYITQVAYLEGTREMYMRTLYSNTWSAWAKIITTEQLIISRTQPTVVNGAVWLKY